MSYFFTGDLITSNASTLLTESKGIAYRPVNDAHETILRGPKTGNASGVTVLHLPGNTGTNGQVLQTDGTGVLSFQNAGAGTPAGSDTQLQFNDGGSFGAIANFTFGSGTITMGTTKVSVAPTSVDNDALALSAGSGGIDMDASALKDINIAGGQVALVSKDDAASAISLTTNIGTSETIVVTNTQGIDPAAIKLTASEGGITITPKIAITTSKGFITSPYTYTLSDTTGGFDFPLVTTTNNAVYLNLSDTSGTDTATWELDSNSTPQEGQNLHLFFDNAGTNNIRLDFGNNLLTSGSGLAQYLTFSNTGQSASLMYISNKWRIINTGAAVS